MKAIRCFGIFMVLQSLFVFSSNAQTQFKALIVTTTRGWHHEAIHYGVVALQEMGRRNNVDMEVWQDFENFTDKYLAQFQVVIFMCTTGDIFDSAQQKVMERFIESGKGYVGIHSAADTEYDWPWYTKLVGRMFHIHPLIQTAHLQIKDTSFSGLQGFTGEKLWTEEWYEYGPDQINDLKTILAVDEKSYNPVADWGAKAKGKGMGALHPIAWYHNYDGGRAFYCGLGHLPTAYTNAAFLDFLYAGIFWAATGKK